MRASNEVRIFEFRCRFPRPNKDDNVYRCKSPNWRIQQNCFCCDGKSGSNRFDSASGHRQFYSLFYDWFGSGCFPIAIFDVVRWPMAITMLKFAQSLYGDDCCWFKTNMLWSSLVTKNSSESFISHNDIGKSLSFSGIPSIGKVRLHTLQSPLHNAWLLCMISFTLGMCWLLVSEYFCWHSNRSNVPTGFYIWSMNLPKQRENALEFPPKSSDLFGRIPPINSLC